MYRSIYESWPSEEVLEAPEAPPAPASEAPPAPAAPGASFEFEVLGLRCGACVQKAEQALREVRGVLEVREVSVRLGPAVW